MLLKMARTLSREGAKLAKKDEVIEGFIPSHTIFFASFAALRETTFPVYSGSGSEQSINS